MINAIYIYRIANLLYRYKVPLIPSFLKLVIFLVYNSSIPYQCTIGKGTRLGYGGIGVVIHKRAIIGNHVMIGTNVTIGGKSGHYDVPKIGNNVYISTGAAVLGPIVIEDNAVIGANAVVICDVVKDAVVGGVPAKELKTK
ncbi:MULTISPECIES: serine O-acetyltransferase [unclassified Carboxylicivirga]|uniref:serine O-acetyltransferase n=1 Tax=Carboxylicivirga TaxID=1628153 RepID=UPI003D355206